MKLSNQRILVVEDEYYIAVELESALKAQGAIVVGPVATLNDAVGALAEPVDGAILDLNLNGDLTYSVAAELKRRRIPFVFATGYGRSAILPDFAEVPHWEKPFEADDLVVSLSKAAGGEIFETARSDGSAALHSLGKA